MAPIRVVESREPERAAELEPVNLFLTSAGSPVAYQEVLDPSRRLEQLRGMPGLRDPWDRFLAAVEGEIEHCPQEERAGPTGDGTE